MDRIVLIGIWTLMLGSCNGLDEETYQFNLDNLTSFPAGFIFSSATASYQVEGAWNESGKGENIWDRIVHTNPEFIVDKENGDIACDSYHKYKEDVQNIKKIGFKMYRFSLSWSRLYPTGNVSQENPDGVRYYNDLLDELEINEIEPMVTIFHWDLPQALEDIGGWLNPSMADIFAEYARAVFKLFGKKVKWWITINEPLSVAGGYGTFDRAPGYQDKHGYGEYIAGHNMLRAHGKAYTIYKNEFRKEQGGKLSLVLCGAFYLPLNQSEPSDVKAAERANQFTFGWYGHPVYSKEGNYPAVMIDYVDNASIEQRLNTSRLPTFTKEEIEEIKGSYDFLSLNHYSTYLASPGIPTWAAVPSWVADSAFNSSIVPGSQPSDCFWMRVTPEGFRSALMWLKDSYNNPEIFVTENGYCSNDTLDDSERIYYYSEYLKQLLRAIKEDKCNIVGYTAWSLMDNFEWKDGYTKRFGLIRVDFDSPNRTRTIKKSGMFFQQLILANDHKESSANLPVLFSSAYLIVLFLIGRTLL